MRLGFVIFDGMTALDFIGVYDPLTRLRSMGFMPEMGWDICAYAAPVADDRGLGFYPTKIAKSLADYDVLIVPGGLATRQLVADQGFIAWLQTAASCPLKASGCVRVRYCSVRQAF